MLMSLKSKRLTYCLVREVGRIHMRLRYCGYNNLACVLHTKCLIMVSSVRVSRCYISQRLAGAMTGVRINSTSTGTSWQRKLLDIYVVIT